MEVHEHRRVRSAKQLQADKDVQGHLQTLTLVHAPQELGRVPVSWFPVTLKEANCMQATSLFARGSADRHATSSVQTLPCVVLQHMLEVVKQSQVDLFALVAVCR